MGRVDDKVALITGAARGQGRSHAVRLAEEGADIIALDLFRQIESVPWSMATAEDMAETVRLVEKTGQRIVAREADVRDVGQVQRVVDEGLAAFGHIDIAVANAAIGSFAPAWEITDAQWRDSLDVNLTGAWNTARAVIPRLIAQESGSIIMTGSVASLIAFENCISYVASKHGVLGVVRSLAVELAAHRVRVNAVPPSYVNTPMIHNQTTYELFRPELDNPTADDLAEVTQGDQMLPIPWLEPVDISNAVLWLASDEARYVTGIALPVDGGRLLK